MRIIIFTFALVTSFMVAKANDILILFTPNDCVNCYLPMYKIFSDKKYDSINKTILIPKFTFNDSVNIVKKFCCNNIRNTKFICSDSLYKALSTSAFSEVLVVKKNDFSKIFYRSGMKNFEDEIFNLKIFCNSINQQEIEVLTPDLLKEGFYLLNINKNHFLYMDDYRNFYILDIFKKKYIPITIDSSVWVKIFKHQFKEEYQVTYKKVLEIANNGNPNILPTVDYVRFMNDTTLLISARIRYKDNKSNKIFNMSKLFEYQPFTAKILNIWSLPTIQNILYKQNKIDYDGNFTFIYNDTVYIHISTDMYSKDSNFNEIFIKLLKKGNKLHYIGFSDYKLPYLYRKYKFYSNFQDFTFDDGIFTMCYSDSIFDIRKNKSIHIPIDTDFYAGYKDTRNVFLGNQDATPVIEHIQTRININSNYQTLSSYNRIIYLTEYNSDGLKKFTPLKLSNGDTLKNSYVIYYHSPGYILYFKNKRGIVGRIAN